MKRDTPRSRLFTIVTCVGLERRLVAAAGPQIPDYSETPRDQVPEAFKWRVEDIFPDQAAWQAEKDALTQSTGRAGGALQGLDRVARADVRLGGLAQRRPAAGDAPHGVRQPAGRRRPGQSPVQEDAGRAAHALRRFPGQAGLHESRHPEARAGEDRRLRESRAAAGALQVQFRPDPAGQGPHPARGAAAAGFPDRHVQRRPQPGVHHAQRRGHPPSGGDAGRRDQGPARTRPTTASTGPRPMSTTGAWSWKPTGPTRSSSSTRSPCSWTPA